MTARERAIRVAIAALLIAGAWGVYTYRRAFIQSVFERGEGGGPAPTLPMGTVIEPPVTPVARVRVVLIDGVGRETAAKLPHYDALCKRGLDLSVDVGFPTVSLPVQSVLWTGLTQRQTGVEFVGKLIDPPLSGLPGKIASVAVAENYQYIVHSLGFGQVLPESPTFADDAAKQQWLDSGFAPAAREAMAGSTPLAFVHILRVDTAGHKTGRDSAEYREAARTADQLAGELIAADGERDDTRWFLLSDHGHRAAGGHGGEEPEIRRIRACIAGAGITPARPSIEIHLIDLSRVIADSLGVAPDTEAAGRALAQALSADPSPGATLPRPGVFRWLIALIVLGAGIAAGLAGSRGKLWGFPLWWVVAYAAVIYLETVPTLSTPMIYKPRGQDMYMAALPGLLVLAVCAGLALRSSPRRMTIGLLAGAAGLTLCSLILCGVDPPVMPVWTAHASLFLVVMFTAMLVVAAAQLVACISLASMRRSGTSHIKPTTM